MGWGSRVTQAEVQSGVLRAGAVTLNSDQETQAA